MAATHLIYLHQYGSGNPMGINLEYDLIIKSPFYPYFYIKDLLGIFICLLFYVIVVCFYPDIFGHPDSYMEVDSLVTPLRIVSE